MWPSKERTTKKREWRSFVNEFIVVMTYNRVQAVRRNLRGHIQNWVINKYNYRYWPACLPLRVDELRLAWVELKLVACSSECQRGRFDGLLAGYMRSFLGWYQLNPSALHQNTGHELPVNRRIYVVTHLDAKKRYLVRQYILSWWLSCRVTVTITYRWDAAAHLAGVYPPVLWSELTLVMINNLF